MPLIVVLDTNMLTVPAQFGVDIFAETERTLERSIEFVVLQSVVSELKRNLVNETRAGGQIFRIALDLVQRCRVVESGEPREGIPVDDEILRYAITYGAVIATNDKRLKERALSQGTPVLYLRGRKQLQLAGFIP